MKTALTTLLCWLCALQLQAQCTASFTTAIVPQGANSLRIEVTNTSNYGVIGINQYTQTTISYGDGFWYQQYTGNNVHNYAAAGTYSVALHIFIIDSLTMTTVCHDSMVQNITVNYQPCATSITQVNGANGQVTFTANNLSSTPGSSYSWDFGDGTALTYGNPVTHTYANNGTYTCTLYDTAGSICTNMITSSVAVTNVFVNCNNLQAQFTQSVTNNAVYFTNTSYLTTSAPGTYITTSWTFGDGSNSTMQNPTHAYAATGTYPVTLIAELFDVLSNSIVCRDSITSNVVITNVMPPMNCSGLNASFTSAVSGTPVFPSSGAAVIFTNTSTPATGTVKHIADWDFGDNTPRIGGVTYSSIQYVYATLGTYTVKLINRWVDTLYGTTCIDSVQQIITIKPLLGGTIRADSFHHTGVDTFKVWLITFDSTSNLLTAVDSVVVTGEYYVPYIFKNVNSGLYRVKAAKINAVAGSYNHVPTYHYSSLYWNTATNIFVGSSNVTMTDILMQHGTVIAGPGFIGGNVSLGANKGSAAGVAGMTILLRDQAGVLVQYAVTNANGDYSFNHVPLGTYSVYPEQMNYTTTASSFFSVSNNILQVNGINFNQDDVKKSIKPRITTDVKNITGDVPFTVYPNPAHQSVTINWNQSAVKVSAIMIADITGKTVIRKQTLPTVDREMIDISKLQPGIYFVKMIAEGSTSVQKLTISH